MNEETPAEGLNEQPEERKPYCFSSINHAKRSSNRSAADLLHRRAAEQVIGAAEGTCLSDAFVTGMSDRVAEPLGAIMPLLLCGEESAVMVFTNLDEEIAGAAAFASGAEHVMARVACEEHFHEYLLSHLVAGLRSNEQPDARKNQRATKLFFMRLRAESASAHLARLSALDSFVTRTLAALQCKTSALRSFPSVMHLYDKIRFDEGNHVRITRDHLVQHEVAAGFMAAEREHVAAAYTELLRPYFDSFEALGVDSDRLRKSIH